MKVKVLLAAMLCCVSMSVKAESTHEEVAEVAQATVVALEEVETAQAEGQPAVHHVTSIAEEAHNEHQEQNS